MRIQYYDVRKKYLIDQLNKEIALAKNKYTYIMEVLNGTIDLRKKTSIEIQVLLKDYMKVDNTYNYLIKMTMDSVSEENVRLLKKEYDTKMAELDELHKISIEQMWLKELNFLEKSL